MGRTAPGEIAGKSLIDRAIARTEARLAVMRATSDVNSTDAEESVLTTLRRVKQRALLESGKA